MALSNDSQNLIHTLEMVSVPTEGLVFNGQSSCHGVQDRPDPLARVHRSGDLVHRAGIRCENKHPQRSLQKVSSGAG